MQESYISLDPERADSMSAQQRARLWNQRVQESCGGQAGLALANQFGVTTMLCSYTLMRSRGFRFTPFGVAKIPGLGGILLAGVLGFGFGSSYGQSTLGDKDQYSYLMQNRGGILAGSASWDKPSQ